jgi:hypothetical protein
MGSDLPSKRISYTRQSITRKIGEGTFPPPDGRTTDSPNSPRWWFESTLDAYLKDRARKFKAAKAAKAAASVDQSKASA